jgi:hypothetical protein
VLLGEFAMIPRISLWSDPIDIPFRLATVPFYSKIKLQIDQVQDPSEIVTITPGAMYILSNIAGRRIMEPIRWVLLDSLQEILLGNLRNQYPERQDLLAPTFGELLGAMLLALRLDGNLEIVRLLETSKTKVPDFFILQDTSSGVFAHLLECKGTLRGVHQITESKSMDLCLNIREYQGRGYEQLTQTNPAYFSYGARAQLRSQGGLRVSEESIASLNLAVTCIPDARLFRVGGGNITFPSRDSCERRRKICLHCAKSSESQRSNPINVIFKEELTTGSPMKEDLLLQIQRYRSASRGLWSNNPKLFESAYRSYVWDLPREAEEPLLVELAIALFKSAIEQGFNPEALKPLIREVLEIVSGEMRDHLGDLLEGREIRQVFIQEYPEPISAEDIPETLMEQDVRSRDLHLIYERMPEERSIHGTIEWHRQGAVLRFALDRLGQDPFDDLKAFVTSVIQSIRANFSDHPLHWREETIQLNERTLDLGVSWDQYPYPHHRSGYPGFTAWVSRDGRAEVVVRFPFG